MPEVLEAKKPRAKGHLDAHSYTMIWERRGEKVYAIEFSNWHYRNEGAIRKYVKYARN